MSSGKHKSHFYPHPLVLVHRHYRVCGFVILLILAWEETLAEASCSVHKSSVPAPGSRDLSSHKQDMENELNMYYAQKSIPSRNSSNSVYIPCVLPIPMAMLLLWLVLIYPVSSCLYLPVKCPAYLRHHINNKPAFCPGCLCLVCV